jgi:uroporphyrinogen III methyltransferase / synthase
VTTSISAGARPGWVYLVGAGPGDPGLITRRGFELLRTCDCVLYDRLVSPELVMEAPEAAERLSVGKRTGPGALAQAEIDSAVVERARAGRSVVRLKGGDPYVLGRGADEAQALAAAGIPFEVVPGVTSVVAAPSYAGIPLTHAGVASSFAVVSGHRPDEVKWAGIASGVDTIVVLMGVTGLAETARRLIEAGRAGSEPAALIEWGTTPAQKTVISDLDSIADSARNAEIAPPATLVVGEVVRLRDALQWFETRPLLGRRVVVTRARHQAPELVARLSELGAAVIAAPVIEIADPPSWEPLDLAVKKVAGGLYGWVVFTSVNGLERFFQRFDAAGYDSRSFGRARIAAVGSRTASFLTARGLKPDVVPESFTGDDLATAIGHGPGSVLLPRVADAPRDIITILEKQGWIPDDVVAYVNVRPEPSRAVAKLIAGGEFDVVTFTSASTVRNFVESFGSTIDLALDEKVVACIGPRTAAAATEAGMNIDVMPDEHTVAALVDALVATPASRGTIGA